MILSAQFAKSLKWDITVLAGIGTHVERSISIARDTNVRNLASLNA